MSEAWTTLCTTATRWEAEMLERLLVGYEIPVWLRDQGVQAYIGMGAGTMVMVPTGKLAIAQGILAATPEEEEDDPEAED